MHIRHLALILLGTGALVGCGGDDAATEPDGPPPTRAEAERVYEDFYAAMFAGDPERACGLLTEEAQQELVDEGKASGELEGETCVEVAEQTSALMQSFGEEPEITFGTIAEGSAGDVAIEATVGDAATRMIPVVRQGDEVLIAGFDS